jgi:Flp pilus assembly protein TadD
MSDAYELYQEGRARLRDGMPAQATVALERAKRLEPDKASIREALGIAYYRITRWEAAEAEFRKVIELSPVDAYAHFALGRSLAKQGREGEATRYLKLAKALEGAPAGTRTDVATTDPPQWSDSGESGEPRDR